MFETHKVAISQDGEGPRGCVCRIVEQVKAAKESSVWIRNQRKTQVKLFRQLRHRMRICRADAQDLDILLAIEGSSRLNRKQSASSKLGFHVVEGDQQGDALGGEIGRDHGDGAADCAHMFLRVHAKFLTFLVSLDVSLRMACSGASQMVSGRRDLTILVKIRAAEDAMSSPRPHDVDLSNIVLTSSSGNLCCDLQS